MPRGILGRGKCSERDRPQGILGEGQCCERDVPQGILGRGSVAKRKQPQAILFSIHTVRSKEFNHSTHVNLALRTEEEMSSWFHRNVGYKLRA